jgi:hypothetical protein
MLLPVLAGSSLLLLVMAWPVLRPAAPPPDILSAFEIARQGDWDSALAISKAYVLTHPQDPVGHFLLGQCYLYGKRVQLTLASGEFETALNIHERTGALGAWEGTLAPEDFAFRVCKVRAVVELRVVREAINFQLPLAFIRRHLLAGMEQVKMGLQLKPDDANLKEMESAMRTLLDELRDGPPFGSTPKSAEAELNI